MIDSAKSDSNEEFQKNLIAKCWFESVGYECNVLGKADLAIYDEGIAKVLFEVKSTENKAEFVKTPNLHFDSSLRSESQRTTPSLRESATADSWQSKSSKFTKQDESITHK